MNGETVERWMYVPTQGMRIHLKIVDDRWLLEGIPAAKPHPVDEVIPTQLDLLKIYEKYGLYNVKMVDRIMGAVEPILAPLLYRFVGRKPWKRQGNY